MKLAMIGTGYVGLVTGTCFADRGNDVICVDNNKDKIDRLLDGEIPIFEPGLSEMVTRNVAAGRLDFTTDLPTAVQGADMVYLAVGTPPAADGSADLTALRVVVEAVAHHLRDDAIVVIKSTVPVGTNQETYDKLQEITGRECSVASNPEFLKEGAAIDDFTHPDRVVVGVRTKREHDLLEELYAPFLQGDEGVKPFVSMSPQSAELTKYVANALLSTKISFINEMANICERVGGDINDVRQGIGHDARIGFAFLAPGVGYGGSCFPKDVRALASIAAALGIDPKIMHAVDEVNQDQKYTLVRKLTEHFGGNLSGKKIAVWGLAFKPKTDDIREAPALVLIEKLLEAGAEVAVHDPEAAANVEAIFGEQLAYVDDPLAALDEADALAINTEWDLYRNPDFNAMAQRMAAPVIFDGRNLFEPSKMAAAGFTYHSIGRGAASEAKQVNA